MSDESWKFLGTLHMSSYLTFKPPLLFWTHDFFKTDSYVQLMVVQSLLATKNWAGPVKLDHGQVKIMIGYIRREIFFQVSVVGDTINVSGQSNCTPVKVPDCRLSEDLGSLFDRSAFSDVTLCVSGREFQAHKAVLAGELEWETFY